MKKLFLVGLGILFLNYVSAQLSIEGIVINEKGNLLENATVTIDDGTIGSSTNEKGEYKLDNVTAGNHTISVSYLGYQIEKKKIPVSSDIEINFQLQPLDVVTEEVFVYATRAGEKTPVAKTTVLKDDIDSRNYGQDMPYLLSLTPSFVTTSDAGGGIGYTGFRIRGTDANRINITINGIPLNDAESHSVYWVNMPDFASSVDNVQIQRGVGTSSNGAGAFGATINMQTNKLERESYATYAASVGSFNTMKNAVSVGTGLLDNGLSFDARLSKISSDGFIDRASSELKSFFVSGGYYSANTILKLNVFSGQEKTYQAWYGVPSAKLNNDEDGMFRYLDHWLWSGSGRVNQKKYEELLSSNARTYNYYTYDNETDNYQQDHYQLLFNHKLSQNLSLNTALHYTYGRGYYEIEDLDQDYADYGMSPFVLADDTVFSTDMIMQKWLDNDFYGGIFSINYNVDGVDLIIGTGWNQYDGRHFGNVIWADNVAGASKDYEWYRNVGTKKDFNTYVKYQQEIGSGLSLYIDLQYRNIVHDINGYDDGRDITQNHSFDFFNPKLGAYFQLSKKQQVFVSWAMAHREPNRSNYVDADRSGKEPTYEVLNDFEVGYQFRNNILAIGLNGYYMSYDDQLILTGQINDVGSAIMTNVEDSYRTGIELTVGGKVLDKLRWDINCTYSQNKIKNFTEYVDNWDTWGQSVNKLGTTDIAFSPSLIANSIIEYSPIKRFKISLVSNYVGKQYIDNTSSEDRVLDAYFTDNLNLSYHLNTGFFKDVRFDLAVNNIFDTEYESNAWVYSYIYGEERHKMDGYFPQAGINFFAGATITF